MLFSAKIHLKHFFYSVYFTLYYFQELVDSARIYYDRHQYTRLYEYLKRTDYCLYQYRAVVGSQLPHQPFFPLIISNRPWHLLLVKYFMVAFLCRSLAISFVASSTDSELKKAVSGTVLFGDASFYIETSTIFWSAICVFFLHYSFGSSFLDYRFLALFRMSEISKLKSVEYFHFGLLSNDYTRFAAFRKYALLSYHSIILGLLVFSFFCLGGLYLQQGLYWSSPFWSIIWTCLFNFWAVNMCTIIYGNLIAFIVVVKYIFIKQRSLVHRIVSTLNQLLKEFHFYSKYTKANSFSFASTWHRLIGLNTQYSHLFDELSEYNSFWRSYLSYIFVFYVLIITFMLYIIFFTSSSSITLYIRIIYALALLVHIALLSLIILLCGSVLAVSGCLAKVFFGILAKFPAISTTSKSLKIIHYHHHPLLLLKLHNTYASIDYCSEEGGFKLLNGYLITFSTFRLLIVNTTLYFILFIRPVN